ncbi:uncharacterized protein LOC111451463 [Cucurbita moschata]|uniref:Uncharacterized protein LOC111451463 n=1 Tax=Cucurbita moschata TaxID=3662 RepID=A0A6J1G791_CUCMO|nr:uncharacterized protein LOC111451463 [Cucurbita moschata]
MEGVRKAPFFRPQLWAAALGCGVVAFCLVQLGHYCTLVVVGGLLVCLAMAAAAAVVTWITVVVFLVLIGRSRRRVVAEGRKISKEIMVGLVVKVLLKEGKVLGGLCGAVLCCLAVAWGPSLPIAHYYAAWDW